MTDTPTLAMLAAVNGAIKAVKARHEGIPDVVVVLGASAPKKHGHFSPSSWQTKPGVTVASPAGELAIVQEDGTKTVLGERVHELFLSGESLSRGAVPTLGTIIHELAHAYAQAQGIADTSNRGRYHNKRFKTIAEGFGLEIGHDKTIGHSPTTVPEATQAEYASEVEALEAALTAYRVGGLSLTGKVKKPAQKWVLVCDCQELPVSKKFVDMYGDNIVCRDCGEEMGVVQS